jgi:hypothetical protein
MLLGAWLLNYPTVTYSKGEAKCSQAIGNVQVLAATLAHSKNDYSKERHRVDKEKLLK